MGLLTIIYFLLPFFGWHSSPPENAYSFPCSLSTRRGMIDCQDSKGGAVLCNVACDNKFQGHYKCSPHEGWDKRMPACATELRSSPPCSLTVHNGIAECREKGSDGTECRVQCDSIDQGYFTCSQGQWDQPLPYCAADKKNSSQCSLTVHNGIANCKDAEWGGKISCDVICNGKGEGDFECTPNKGWNRNLPSCASELGSNPRCSITVRNGTASCQDEGNGNTCKVYCEGKDQGEYKCSDDKWDRKLPYCAYQNKNFE